MDLRRGRAAEEEVPRSKQVFHLVEQQHRVRSLPQHAGRHGQFGQPLLARRLPALIVSFPHRAQFSTDLSREHLGEFSLACAGRSVEQNVHAWPTLGERVRQQVTHQIRVTTQSFEIPPFSLRRSGAREHQRDQVHNAVDFGQKREGQAIRQIKRHPAAKPTVIALHQSRVCQPARGAHGSPDFMFRCRAEPRQQKRHRDLPCFKRAIDNMFEPVEQLVEGNEGQSGCLDPGQPEVIAKEGCVALNGFCLSSPC